VAATPAASAAPAPMAVASAPAVAAPVARPSDESKAVTAAVREWASAWSRKDLNDYFASYMPGFKGSDSSASAWQSNRRQRIMGKRRISVEISGLNVEINKNVARVSFRQSYVADLLRVSSQKTLELEHHNGKWLIRKESTG
jgi:opacity protein-like surface antigen